MKRGRVTTNVRVQSSVCPLFPLVGSGTDGNLQGLSGGHAVQSLLEVLQVKDIGDHSLDVELSSVEVLDSPTEAVELREGSDNLDLVAKDPRRGPVDLGVVVVDTVDHEGTTSSDVVNGSLGESLNTGALDNTVESVRVVLLELGPLLFSLLTTSSLEPDVLVGAVELLGNVHLQTVVGSNDDLGSTVELEELSHTETGGTGTQQENLGTSLGLKLVDSVNGTTCGLEQSSLFVGDVGVLENLGLVVGQVLGESTVHGDTLGGKVFTKQWLSSPMKSTRRGQYEV